MVTGVFLSTACTRGRPRECRSFKGRAGLCGLLLILMISFVPMADSAAQSLDIPAMSGGPTYRLEVIAKIEPKDHPGFGMCVGALGDINDDGYDDLAVGTWSDTTFIYLGGDTIDHTADYYVLGGSHAIATGDFNGDGLPDIATAEQPRSARNDEYRGKIRIYLHTSADPPYAAGPDRIMIGAIFEEGIGTASQASDPGLVSADVNGDGVTDLLFGSGLSSVRVPARVGVLLGGPDIRTKEPDAFLAQEIHERRTSVSNIRKGDINGDGCDDIVVLGFSGGYVMHIWLGRTDGAFGGPDYVGHRDSAWVPVTQISNVADIDGDGYADIIDGYPYFLGGPVPISRGSMSLQRIEVNDSIPNPDTITFRQHLGVFPVGDMSGNGHNDVVIGYKTWFFPDGIVYLVYPSGSGNRWREAIGYIGINPEYDHLAEGAYPAGDLNGDGYQDMVIAARPPHLQYRYDRVWVCGGSPKLVSGIHAAPIESAEGLELSPQPLRTGQALRVRIVSDKRSEGDLRISDLLGRTLYKRTITLQSGSNAVVIQAQSLSPGTYLLNLRLSSEQARSRMFIVL